MLRRYGVILAISFVMGYPIAGRADDGIPSDTTEVEDSTLVSTDSLDPVKTIQIDTLLFTPGNTLVGYGAVTDSIDRESRLRQRPMAAMFKSMVLPGWGQYGNRRYVKALVYAGLEAWMVGAALHYHDQASDFHRQYEKTPVDNISLRNDYYSLYTDRKDERSKYVWFGAIIVFVSMFDAYVDAHLSGFPRDNPDGLSFELSPTKDKGFQAVLSLSF